MALRNRDLSKMGQVAPEWADKRALRKNMFDVLVRLVLVVEEKPVVTRFFLFAPCAFALLRMKLLGLPARLLSIGAIQPAAESARRVQAVLKFYKNPEADAVLRRVGLCLRLALFATSLTAQRASGDAGADPPLVRLGKREVQERTSALLVEMLPLLPGDPVLDKALTLRNLLLTQAHLIMRFESTPGSRPVCGH